MKKLMFLAVLMTLMAPGIKAQDFPTLINEAETLFYQGRYGESAERYEKAFKTGRASEIHLYGAACAWAKSGQKEKAMEKLKLAIDRGWMSLDPLLSDPDLASLRGTSDWNNMIGELRERIGAIEAGYDRTLIAQLAEIEERDQRYRRQIRTLTAQGNADPAKLKELELLQAELDAMNIAALNPIIEKYGYPGKELVGNKCEVAFMVLQNADLETQKYYMATLEKAANRDDIAWFSYMRMVERMDTQEGRLQLYGANSSPRNGQSGELSAGADRRSVAVIPEKSKSRWDVDYRPSTTENEK